MPSFKIAVTGWGVFIEIKAPLTNADRTAFVEQLKVARERVTTIERYGILLDLRRVDIVGDPDERVRAYVGIIGILSGRRIAVMVENPQAAARMTEALDVADLLGDSRIIIREVGIPNALVSALRWVDDGVEPDAPDEG